jgi:hypothetical protein
MNQEQEMDRNWIDKRQTALFEEAKIAAIKGDLPGLSKANQKLVSFQALLQQLNAIRPDSSGVQPTSQPVSNDTLEAVKPAPQKIGESDKERGQRIRDEWVFMHMAATLTPIRGQLYRMANGETLGIAYGQEQQDKPGRWFVGLPIGKFSCAMLLCQPLTGDLFWINLSKEFLAKYSSQFSKSKIGQVKFSLFKRNGIYYLQVPTFGRVPMTENLNKLPHLN